MEKKHIDISSIIAFFGTFIAVVLLSYVAIEIYDSNLPAYILVGAWVIVYALIWLKGFMKKVDGKTDGR